MRHSTILTSVIFILCITQITASAYTRGLVTGIVKNRIKRNIKERERYAELNFATCPEPNPTHNPFIETTPKDPNKCYDEDRVYLIPTSLLLFISLILMIFLLNLKSSDAEAFDFILGMLVADMIEDMTK
tara:strand:+ start:204 stop:593 length:390 start_codon:yes stop_codon:yes gene_type:complete